jgi:cobalt/nickel transport system permease protein
VGLILPGHSHGDVVTIDLLCRRSKYCPFNGGLKVAGCVLLLCLCVASRSPWPPCLLSLVLAALTVAGGIPLRKYLSLLVLPLVFLLLGALTLLWDYAPQGAGLVSIPAPGGWFVLTVQAQDTARLVLARALGGVSCLYFLSLSTPMTEILSVLERLHVPGVLIDLAVLIYRYLFLMLDTHRDMRAAAESRLGYGGLRRSLHTTGLLYGSLLGRSFRRASGCLAAMESRGYTSGIRVLHRKKPWKLAHIALFAGLCAGMAAGVALTWR